MQSFNNLKAMHMANKGRAAKKMAHKLTMQAMATTNEVYKHLPLPK